MTFTRKLNALTSLIFSAGLLLAQTGTPSSAPVTAYNTKIGRAHV